MTTAEFILHLESCSPRRTASGWEARCPCHDDHKASLSIAEGKDGRILLKCFAGCPTKSIVGALGLKMSDLFPARAKEHHEQQPRIVATYDYQDEAGKLLFQCVRYEPKKFKQRRPDPQKAGAWIWNLKDTRCVFYRLPEVLAAVGAGRTIFIAEGEKDCDALAKAGFVATCNPMGAGKWLPEHTSMLLGAARVVVIPDKDEAGRNHAEQVVRSLLGKAKSVRVIELPDRADNRIKDASNFFDAGGTADELRAIVKATPEYTPSGKPRPTEQGSTASENLADHPEKSEDPEPVRLSVATQLVRMVEHFEFFHDPQSRGFARMEVNGHVEVWPVNSKQFGNLLAQTYYRHTRKAANRNALADAVATLHGRALFDGAEALVFLRVAPHGEDMLIDLCDPQWRVIRVTPGGWEVLDKSPVAFIRTAAMRPLPIPAPAPEGSLNPLWKLLNVTCSQRPLIAGALLNGFHPHGPYFVINYVGEQGSAKSCAARIHRQLIDPNETPLRSPPRDERDLLVQGASNRCVTLDNLSRLSPWLSDGLCRLATGGGHSARSLYTDLDEISISVKRPVVLNGIEDVAVRPDLAERALQIELDTIGDDRRRSERGLWQEFESARPVIFSAILNGLVCALSNLPTVRLDGLPRMADAAIWATAGETAFGWEQGTFASAYAMNLSDGATASIESHSVGVAIQQLLGSQNEWAGEPAQLLEALNAITPEHTRHSEDWPNNPRALSGHLRRLAQALRRSGIDLTRPPRGKRRSIRLCKAGIPASAPSAPSPIGPNNDANDGYDAKKQPLHDGPPLAGHIEPTLTSPAEMLL